MENIINFNDYNKKKSLTDEEIKSLFLGLVNLIKSSAIENVSSKLKQDYKDNAIKLNNTIMELKLKNEIIEDLKKENEILKSKQLKLITKIENLNKNKNLSFD